MPSESPELLTMSVRNQALLEGFKKGSHEEFAPYLKRIDREVRALILGAPDAPNRKQLDSLIVEVGRVQAVIYGDYNSKFAKQLSKLSVQQAEVEAKAYSKVVVNYESLIPSEQQLAVAIKVNPLGIENYTGVPLLQNYVKDLTAKESQRLKTVIQQGFRDGLTNQQISRNVRGTAANGFRDGALNSVNNANDAMVRTAVQHVATQAQQATMKANSDLVKGYKIVVTFDGKTTTLCYDIGQQDVTYKIGEGPLPPLHWGCRDATVAVLSDKYDFLDKGLTRASRGVEGGAQVSAKLGSYDWMLTQPISFQEASMGVTRSKLLRDGGLTPTEFAKLSTNKRLQTLTLKEMREKSPAIFERAGL